MADNALATTGNNGSRLDPFKQLARLHHRLGPRARIRAHHLGQLLDAELAELAQQAVEDAAK